MTWRCPSSGTMSVVVGRHDRRVLQRHLHLHGRPGDHLAVRRRDDRELRGAGRPIRADARRGGRAGRAGARLRRAAPGRTGGRGQDQGGARADDHPPAEPMPHPMPPQIVCSKDATSTRPSRAVAWTKNVQSPAVERQVADEVARGEPARRHRRRRAVGRHRDHDGALERQLDPVRVERRQVELVRARGSRIVVQLELLPVRERDRVDVRLPFRRRDRHGPDPGGT